MKLSLSWIFDHINADWRKQDIDYLISKFNAVSGEMEDFYKVKFNLKNFAIGRVIEINHKSVKLNIPEWDKDESFPVRSDAIINHYFMVTSDELGIRYAKLNDFNLAKEGLIPDLYLQEKELDGSWKEKFETEDIILEVDNKSITNRPDMWCHRGFAREIAAFMDLEFLPESKFLDEKPVFDFDKKTKITKTNPISIVIDDESACARFSGIYFESIKNRPTDILILSRFLKIDVRPINMLVDLTNYLMLDWSQPVHVYDAKTIEGEKIIARSAKKHEKLKLLDEVEIELVEQDLVIADNKKVLGLAGIMGGYYSGISKDTTSVFFESANFDPAVIRRTSLRHKVRTESSMRLEKTLDKNLTTQAILRFLNLLRSYKLEFIAADEIISVGTPAKEVKIELSHEFLEKKSGIELQEYDVTLPLTRLGFKVEINTQEKNGFPEKIYSILVPSFRSSKDISIKEDILEEIIRFYGYDKISLELPQISKIPNDLSHIFRLRDIKNYLINTAKMTEQQNYIFLNEIFLQSIGLKIENIVAEVVNPVSTDMYRLTNSLLINLFKNIKDNFAYRDSLRFFEFGRVWKQGVKDDIVEKRSLAGIFFEKKSAVNFYSCKSYITDILNLVGINFKETVWEQVIKPDYVWAMPYQTAKIFLDGKKIGIVGKVDPSFLSKLDVLPESDAFFFDLDGDFLINHMAKTKKFVPLLKYQETYFDLSLFVPLNVKTVDIESKLKKVSDLIINVDLIDSFEREEWSDKRSLTFRILLADPEKTIEKVQIDEVWQNAVKTLEKLDIKLRD